MGGDIGEMGGEVKCPQGLSLVVQGIGRSRATVIEPSHQNQQKAARKDGKQKEGPALGGGGNECRCPCWRMNDAKRQHRCNREPYGTGAGSKARRKIGKACKADGGRQHMTANQFAGCDRC